ncbi:MAG: hypothetical protein WEB67_11100 [Acidimicrobiia bacterium]
MTGAKPSEQEATFAETYDRLARAWADHEDLRHAGATIPEQYRSSLRLSEARDEMWSWWAKFRIQRLR